jgi:predicted DCC family thiol-disulfide oxidoreductase YuxK
VRHRLLFDEACGFCDRSTRFVLARDRRGVFHAVPLRDPSARAVPAVRGDELSRLDTLRVVLDAGTPRASLRTRSAAVFAELRELGRPRRALTAFSVLPRTLLDAAYDAFARNRHRWSRRGAESGRPSSRRGSLLE